MLAINRVTAAVKKKLENTFKNIKIQSQDISEGFKRPSFFIELDNININDFMTKLQETELTVRISYFPSKVNYNTSEIYSTLDVLNRTFIEDNLLELEEGYVTEVNESNISVIDKVLHFDFDIFLSEEYVRKLHNEETMEELEIDIHKEVE